MKHFTFLVAFISIALSIHAQKENNIWYFGQNAKIDFNSGTPKARGGSAMYTEEGCASICDKQTGDILFYTNGINVYNRSNQKMPSNTSSLGGHVSSTQSALILPKPGSSNLYYIFAVGAEVGSASGIVGQDSGLKYSVIDMSLDGGKGDVAQQPQTLIAPVSEKLTAVQMANGNGYWVLAHTWYSTAFYAYPVTSSGIGTPVISNAGSFYDDYGARAIGYLKASPDGTKLAAALTFEVPRLEVFNFNNTTGVVGNMIMQDTTIKNPTEYGTFGPYGLTFSPNSLVLYADVAEDANLYQYNMAAGNEAAIRASRQVVATATGGAAPRELNGMQIAPDGKIYIASTVAHINRINNPNVIGTGCGYEQEALELDSLNYFNCNGGAGLPNGIEHLTDPISTGIQQETDLDESVTVYPNPSSTGNWQLTVDNSLVGSKAEIYDATGRLVFQSAISNLKTEIAVDVSPGMYYLKIITINRAYYKPLLKQ